jgi:hypothetical protein
MAGLFRRRRSGPKPGQSRAAVFDREATKADLEHLREFAKTRRGVEFYIEPETFATDTTVVAIATDGEWTRRRVSNPDNANSLARSLSLPIYRAEVTGYPQRMRDWSARNPDRKLK